MGCAVADVLVPGNAGAKNQSVRFALASRQPVSVTEIHVLGSGTSNGRHLKESHLGLHIAPAEGDVEQSGDVLSIPVKINPSALPADHYTGTLRLTLKDADSPVTVPIDFVVRNPPLGALIALLLGIALGRLSQYLKGQGGALLEASHRARLLRRRVNRAGGDQQALLNRIADAEAAIDDDDVDQATKILDEVEAKPAAAGTPTVGRDRAGIPGVLAKVSPVRGGLGLGAHVLGAAVWIGLLLTGFQTLYFASGTTLGANGIFDYVGLVLWGLSADVASRGLGNLTAVTPSAPA